MDIPEDVSVPWTRLAGFELHEEIGRGGMGVVYRARQEVLDRIVAVKVLLHPKFAGRGERQRFQREAKAAARLRHPGIVGMIDVGEDDAVPWFSMEHVSGRNLEQRILLSPPDCRQAARWVRQVAEAVQHAHDQGVLHRDLKPSNILLDEADNPRVTDFGIARIAGDGDPGSDAGGLTRTGQMLGSPGYAAPEQALGGEVDARTDVYGLGALLYHLLAGRPPFQGLTLDAILLQLREHDPPPPRRLNPAVPRDLETICLKCLRKSPSGRYPTASAVAEDLAAFLEGRAIAARPQGALEKTWRWCQRRPAAALMLVTIVSLVAALVGGAIVFSRKEARMDHRAALLSEARALRDTRSAGSRTQALATLAEAWKIAPSMEIRDEAIACLALPEVTLVEGEPPAEPAPDPTSSGNGLLSAAFDGGEIVISDRSKAILHRLPGQTPGSLMKLDGDGTRLAVVAPGSGDLKIFSVSDGRLIFSCTHPLPVDSLDWGGDLIATGCANRFIYIWDDHGNLKHRLSGHQSKPVIVKFRPNGQELCSASHDPYLRVWHAARGVEMISHQSRTDLLARLWWSGDGTRLHADTADGAAKVYQIDWSPCLDLLAPPQEEPHSENLGSASFNRDGSMASVIDETVARVWDFKQGRVAGTVSKPNNQWLSSRFSPDGSSLWICGWAHPLANYPVSRDGTGRASLGIPPAGQFGPGNLLRDGTPDGKRLVLSNNSVGQFIVVDPASGASTGLSHPGTLGTCISPGGDWVLTSSHATKGAKIWSLPEGKPVRKLLTGDTVMQAAFSPDGKRVLLHASSGARAFRTTDWSEISLPEGTRLRSVAFSPDGRHVASLSEKQILLFDAESMQPLAEIALPEHVGWLGEAHAVFSGDGRYLLVHTASGSVVRWDVSRMWQELAGYGFSRGEGI